MPKKLTLEDQLTALRQLRAAPNAAALESLLASATHGIILKGAAELVQSANLPSLAPALAATALRFGCEQKRDPGGEGKTAVLRTLIDGSADLRDFYLQAATWVQLEPTIDKPRDAAAECRGLAAIGIARTRPPNAITLLVDLLADPQPVTRLYAAMAFRAWHGPESLPVLRLKAHLGDDDPDVLGETFASLLAHDPRDQLPFVASFLQRDNLRLVEVAALALGQTHLDEALAPLAAAFEQFRKASIHTTLLMAIAQLRTDRSLEWLLNQVKSAPLPLASSALTLYRGDSSATAHIRAAADRRETAAFFRELFST